MFSQITRVALGLLVWIAPSVVRGADAGQLTEAESKALKYRSETAKQGYVRFRVANKVSSQPVELLYETTFDRTRIVQFRRVRLLGQSKWSEARGTAVTPEEYVVDAHSSVPVEQRNQKRGSSRSASDLKVLHPQMLGFDLNGADWLDQARLDCVIISPSARMGVSVRNETRDGVATVRLDYTTKLGGHPVSVWIAPSKGHGVVAAEHRTKSGMTTSIACQFAQYPAGGVWYPSQLVKTVASAGVVQSQQLIVVEEARFGQRIEAASFSLASFGLKPGRMIVEDSAGTAKARVWDGKQAIDAYDVPPTAALPGGLDRPRWFLALASLVLAVATLYFARILLSRRRLDGPKSSG